MMARALRRRTIILLTFLSLIVLITIQYNSFVRLIRFQKLSKQCPTHLKKHSQLPHLYFDGMSGSKEITADDRISPFDMKILSDFYWGSLPMLSADKSRLTALDENLLQCLQDGVVIFVDSPSLISFLLWTYPLIDERLFWLAEILILLSPMLLQNQR